MVQNLATVQKHKKFLGKLEEGTPQVDYSGASLLPSQLKLDPWKNTYLVIFAVYVFSKRACAVFFYPPCIFSLNDSN